MKKIIVLFMCLIIAFSSCKKKNIAPENTISLSLDGVSESFTTNIYASVGNGIDVRSNAYFSGINADSKDAITLKINSNATIAKGDYTNTSNSGFMSIVYTKGSSGTDNYTTDVNGTYISTITITSVSNTNVQGIFNGKLVYRDGKTIKTVTDGKFNLTIQ